MLATRFSPGLHYDYGVGSREPAHVGKVALTG